MDKLIKLLEQLEERLDTLEEIDETETKEYALIAWFRSEINSILMESL